MLSCFPHSIVMVIISEIKIQMNPRTKAIPVNNRLCKVSNFKTIYTTTDALSSTCDIPRQQTSPRTQRRQRQTSQAWSRCSLLAWTRNVQICNGVVFRDDPTWQFVQLRGPWKKSSSLPRGGEAAFRAQHTLAANVSLSFVFQVDLTCKKSLVKKWLQMFPAR